MDVIGVIFPMERRLPNQHPHKSPNYKPPWNLEDKEIGNVVHSKPTNWSYLK